MATYYTPIVDDTDNLDAAVLNGIFESLDEQIVLNVAALALLAGSAYPGAGATLKADVNSSAVNAATVGGLSASEIGNPDDGHFPRMAETSNGGVWSSATYTTGKGMCQDVNGHVWVGVQDGTNCKVAKFAAGRMDTSPGIYNLSETGMMVVELVATRLGVFAVLSDDSNDGWATSVTAGGVAGKLVKIDHDTGAVDTAWGTSGKITLSSNDPWCAFADDTYIWIGFLTAPGKVAYIELADTAAEVTLTAATNYNYVTALAPYMTDASDWAIMAGFHDLSGTTEGAACVIGSSTPSFDTYYTCTAASDHDQFTAFASAFGILLAGINVRASGTKVVAWEAASPNGGSGTVLSYLDIGLHASPGTYSTTPKFCIAPDGTVYVANGATTGSVGRFTSVKFFGIQEVLNVDNGGIAAEQIMHDGQHLWLLGNDGSQVYVSKLAF